MDLYLGVDIGASHISSKVLDADGQEIIANPNVAELNGQESNHEFSQKLIGYIEPVLQMVPEPLTAIGIGSPGPLDPVRCVVENPPNFRNLANFPIANILEKKFKIPCFLLNDADAAALGEWWLGGARGFSDVIMLTLGSGVGSGIVAGGKLQRGMGRGGEWGHTTVNANETRICSCGRRNCLEAFVSARGLARTYCDVFTHNYDQMTKEQRREVSFMIREGLKRHDRTGELWRLVLHMYAIHLSGGLKNIINVHNPECVILGGGIAKDNTPLIFAVEEVLADSKGSFAALYKRTAIRLAKLDNPGIFGAAKYAIECLYDRRSMLWRPI